MVRNILAVIVGIVAGSVLNGSLISLGHILVPLPAGADVSTFEGLKAAMPLFGPEQFVFPFLAHALGTLVGALICVIIAVRHRFKLAMLIGVLFLVGGTINAFLLPVPLWYDAIDLILAYIPMAWIGARLGGAGRGA